MIIYNKIISKFNFIEYISKHDNIVLNSSLNLKNQFVSTTRNCLNFDHLKKKFKAKVYNTIYIYIYHIKEYIFI